MGPLLVPFQYPLATMLNSTLGRNSAIHPSGSGLWKQKTTQSRPILSTPFAERVITGPLLLPAPGSTAKTPNAPCATQNGMISSARSTTNQMDFDQLNPDTHIST